MRAVIQRVRKASVYIRGISSSRIGHGLVILIAVGRCDTDKDVTYLVNKITQLRVFSDESQRFILSALEVKAELLVVSQFTLYGQTRKGSRLSFTDAAPASMAEPLYDDLVNRLRQSSLEVQTGTFGEHMEVELIGDGPVTIWIDSTGQS
jgi:D-tyrosyl-tRNA(Tyr) deacylase